MDELEEKVFDLDKKQGDLELAIHTHVLNFNIKMKNQKRSENNLKKMRTIVGQ